MAGLHSKVSMSIATAGFFSPAAGSVSDREDRGPKKRLTGWLEYDSTSQIL
jgi:hypothetical protein